MWYRIKRFFHYHFCFYAGYNHDGELEMWVVRFKKIEKNLFAEQAKAMSDFRNALFDSLHLPQTLAWLNDFLNTLLKKL
jgi:hypothetical protein